MKALKKFLATAVIMMALSACGEKKQDNPAPKPLIGKYLYIDANGVSHINNDCWNVRHLTLNDDVHGNYALHRVLIDTLNRSQLEKTCSECISDNIYDMLLERAGTYNSNEGDSVVAIYETDELGNTTNTSYSGKMSDFSIHKKPKPY